MKNQYTDDRLPEGTVTFLFTDIEGSTWLVEYLGDEYTDLLVGSIRKVGTVVKRRVSIQLSKTHTGNETAFVRRRFLCNNITIWLQARTHHSAHRRGSNRSLYIF